MAYEREHTITARAQSWVRWAGAGLAVAIGVVALAFSSNIAIAFFLALSFQMFAWIASQMGVAGTTNGKHTLRVEAGAVKAGEFPVIGPRTRIALPEIRREPDGMVLRLRTQLRIIDIQIADEAQGEEIASALAPRAAQTSFYLWRAPLPAVGELGLVLVIPALLLFVVSLFSPTFVVPLVILSTLLVVAAALARILSSYVEVTVGADGLLVRQALRPPRFIRHAQIREVRAEGSEIAIDATNEQLRFAISTALEPSELDAAYAAAIARRIEGLRASCALRPAAPPETPGLLRGTRSAKDWLEGLRKLGEGGESAFRDAAPPRDQLWQIVESIDAPAVERIAAAIALKASGLAPEEAPRLRVAAEGSVEPEVGDPLRIVCDREPDALADVLEEAQKEEA